jgi:putative hemolysin
MKLTREKILVILVILGSLTLMAPVSAMKDPSAVYCKAMGYSYETVHASAGEYGVCRMPSHQYIDSWKFLRGEAGQNYNYCTRMGYASKVSTDPEKCSAIADIACSVCVLPDKREVEVSTLMNLSFAETTCGDGRCVITETFETCPKDCPQSGSDGICQKITDLKCDPDCIDGKGDTDCAYLGNPLVTILIVLVVLLIIVLALWFILKKRKQAP